ncbi:hypothetical protein ALO45_101579 [Pseudomonas syringae pv. syringae]|nr:hypothetical protein ALO45_101579 [Pseudomonas syringae pv. syringae]
MRRLKFSVALGADVGNPYFQKVAMPEHRFNQAASLWLGQKGASGYLAVNACLALL